MSGAKTGDVVTVHYRGTLDGGEEFDSSHDREPLSVTIGDGRLIPAFEDALIGMGPGDTRTVKIAAADAYGPYRDELVQQVPRAEIPAEVQLEVGGRVRAMSDGGQQVVLTVIEVADQHVTLDANHPLAGQDLTFELTIVAIAA